MKGLFAQRDAVWHMKLSQIKRQDSLTTLTSNRADDITAEGHWNIYKDDTIY